MTEEDMQIASALEEAADILRAAQKYWWLLVGNLLLSLIIIGLILVKL